MSKKPNRKEKRQAMALARRDRTLAFATKYHKNVHGEHLEFENFFYMLDILADPSPFTAIISAVQTGKTECFVCKLFADCSLGLSVFYVMPTQDARNVFVPNRINRLLRKVDYYGGLVEPGAADSVLLKQIGDGVVRFGASQAVGEFKEFPADVLYIDEYDVCNPQGISLAYDRCKASPYKFRHYLSNPDLPGSDDRQNIDWYFQNSDQKRLHYKCPHCGHVQTLDWFVQFVREVAVEGIVIDYELQDEEWSTSAGRDILPACESCGNVFNRSDTCVGWVPCGDPQHPVSGWEISRLAPPDESIYDLWMSFRQGIGNETHMKTFINSDLGKAYRGGMGNNLSEALIERCIAPYSLPSPGRIKGPCTMGVDVGKQFDVRISDYPLVDKKRKRRLVYAGKVPTQADLHRLIEEYRVATCVIDAYPEIRLSKDFQKKAKCKVWRCAYHPTESGNPRSIRWDSMQGEGERQDERVVWVDRTEAMDAVYGQYVRQEVMEPRGFRQILRGRYIAELSFPVRIINEKTGRFVWTKGTDHAFHANVYDWLAGRDPTGSGFATGTAEVHRGRNRQKDFDVQRQDPVNSILRRSKRGKKYRMWEEVSG